MTVISDIILPYVEGNYICIMASPEALPWSFFYISKGKEQKNIQVFSG